MSEILIDPPAAPQVTPRDSDQDSHLVLLVHHIAAGDHAALAELYDLLSGDVRSQAQVSFADSRDVDVVVAATFLQVWWLAALHDGNEDDVRGWIARIASGRVADRHRNTVFSAPAGHQSKAPLAALSSAYDETLSLVLASLLERRAPRHGS